MSSSVDPECSPAKERYDACFIRWYSEKFLRGDTSSNDCDQLFKDYRKCLERVLNTKGINQMLEEARRNSGENIKPDK